MERYGMGRDGYSDKDGEFILHEDHLAAINAAIKAERDRCIAIRENEDLPIFHDSVIKNEPCAEPCLACLSRRAIKEGWSVEQYAEKANVIRAKWRLEDDAARFWEE